MAKAKVGSAESVELNRKLRLYVILNIGLVVIALLLLDTFGLLNLKRVFMPLMSSVPVLNRLVPQNVEDPYLLSREERKKEQYTLKVWEDNLKAKQQEIDSRSEELSSLEQKLTDEKDEIKMMVKAFQDQKNEYNNYKKNVVQQARYIESMRPEDAVVRLQEMDDLTVIDILREIETAAQREGRTSIVSYLLSLIEPKRASRIQRKMLNMED